MNCPSIALSTGALPVVEIDGRRVVTFAMIDQVHQRKEGTAQDTFLRIRDRLVPGKDFQLLDYSKRDVLTGFTRHMPKRGLTVLFETGYLKLTKPMSDDLSWEVMGELVERYFATAPASRDEVDALRHEVGRLHSEIGFLRGRLADLEPSHAARVPRLELEWNGQRMRLVRVFGMPMLLADDAADACCPKAPGTYGTARNRLQKIGLTGRDDLTHITLRSVMDAHGLPGRLVASGLGLGAGQRFITLVTTMGMGALDVHAPGIAAWFGATLGQVRQLPALVEAPTQLS